MKLLFLVSSLDLTQPFSATPAWWQLMKGLYEIGVEVIATPYQGPAVESLWWRAEPNPGKFYGDAFQTMRETMRKLVPPHPSNPKAGFVSASPTQAERGGEKPVDAVSQGGTAAKDEDSMSDVLVRRAAQTLIAPLWLKHLDGILTREPDIDAVIVLTAPLNHLVGVASALQRRHHKPIFYYDGDVPASLPNMSGFASGFRIYQGADLSEYTAFISNSAGGAAAIKELGAREVHPLFYGADPDVFSPVDVPRQDIDVLFYGHGREYRDEWIDAMITQPSTALPYMHFAVRGTKLGDIGKAEALPYLSFSKLREYACRSLINLCITRAAHAGVFASSSSRPFELASMGCCIVANPYDGIETWFEPDKEIFIVHSGEEAEERYRYLRTHDSDRIAAGRAARERVLKQHTFRHRARELCEIVKQYV